MKKYLTTLFLYMASILYGFEAPPNPEPPPLIHEEQKKEATRFDDSYAPYLEKPDTEDFRSKFFRMLFVLALLIGFMILASIMLRRMNRTRVSNLNTSSSIKVLEVRRLSPKSTLYLMEVNDQQLLIAESPYGVHHLASLIKSEGEEQEQ